MGVKFTEEQVSRFVQGSGTLIAAIHAAGSQLDAANYMFAFAKDLTYVSIGIAATLIYAGHQHTYLAAVVVLLGAAAMLSHAYHQRRYWRAMLDAVNEIFHKICSTH